MNPHLARLQNELATLIAGRSAQDMAWHPPGKWSAAEVLEHLYLSYTGTIKGFEKVIAAGKPLATSPTLAQRWQTFVLTGVGYFPSGRKSPSVAQPRGLAPERVLAEIGPKIAEMDEIISTCESKFGAGRKLLDHPIVGPLDAHEWRKLHLAHGLHHAKQIRRLFQTGPPS